MLTAVEGVVVDEEIVGLYLVEIVELETRPKSVRDWPSCSAISSDCATTLPRRSRSAAEQSCASRTMGECAEQISFAPISWAPWEGARDHLDRRERPFLTCGEPSLGNKFAAAVIPAKAE